MKIPTFAINIITLTFGGLNTLKAVTETLSIYDTKLEQTIKTGCNLTYIDYVKPIRNNCWTPTKDSSLAKQASNTEPVFCDKNKLTLEQKTKAMNMTMNYVGDKFGIFSPTDEYLTSVIENHLRVIKYQTTNQAVIKR